MASGIPKRASNLKKKTKRQASWERSQERKRANILENDARHAANIAAGSTPRQRKSAAHREANKDDSVSN